MPLLATGLDVCRRLSLTILQYTISVLQLAPQHNAVATFTVCGVHGLWQQVIMSRVLAECQKASLPELCWFCLSENEAAPWPNCRASTKADTIYVFIYYIYCFRPEGAAERDPTL